MSNKTQLATNNTQLASLIQTLQGKAAGGGGSAVETCTVNFSGFTLGGTAAGFPVFYQTVEDGEVVLKHENGVSLSSVTMLCNGLLVGAVSTSVYSSGIVAPENIEVSLDSSCYGSNFNLIAVQPKLSAGESGTITLSSGNW